MTASPRFTRDPLGFHGRLETPVFESEALRQNPLGDPHRRELPVYLPPQALADGSARFPVVFVLAGFTGRGQSMLETHPWKEGLVRRIDRAIEAGECPPLLLVLPDCFTRLGGSQYVDSPAVGAYATHIARELVPFVEAAFPVRPGVRGVAGKSSGGFGALHLAMNHPGLFRAVASVAGDCHFEFGYAHDFLPALRGLQAFDRDPAAFLRAFHESHDLSGDGHAVLNLLAMSACYSPNPQSPLGFDLPIDLESGERVPEVWERWLAFDPVVACERHVDALRALDQLHLEAGKGDEFFLQFAQRHLSRRLDALGVPYTSTEFEGGHFGLDPRVALVLQDMARVLSRA